MSDLFWLSEAQLERLTPVFPLSYGKPRDDGRRVLSGIVSSTATGFVGGRRLSLEGGTAAYGPPKTLYNRRVRWSRLDVFARIMAGLATEHGQEKTVMVDATYLKAHRTATSMGVKKGRGRLIGRTKNGMNTRLHDVCDSYGGPLNLFVTAGKGERLHRRSGIAEQSTGSRLVASGSWLRRRFGPRTIE